MKKSYLFSMCLAILFASASAQTSTERIYIKGGNSAWENFMKEIFRYPSFDEGVVEFKNGQRFKSTMNYNKVLGTIEFIDEKGDTLAMTDEENIRSISIGSDVFTYNPLCILALRSDGKPNLYEREVVRIADKLKTGGYGIPNSTGTIESIDRLDTKINYNQIEINENLLVSKVTTFYIENERGEIATAGKKNILNMFSKHEDQIKAFIKSHSVDFTKKDDLLALTDFISKL